MKIRIMKKNGVVGNINVLYFPEFISHDKFSIKMLSSINKNILK